MNPELIKSLNEIITLYKYRGINWIPRTGKPILFPKEKTIVFENFYSADGKAYEGVCQELTYQAFLDIKKYHSYLYDDLRLYRVTGGDPNFFSTPVTEIVNRFGNVSQIFPHSIRGQHVFLAVTDTPMLNYGETLTGQQAFDALLKANAYIFDPSFQVFHPLSEAGYLIEQIWSPGCKLSNKTNAEVFIEGNILTTNAIIGISQGIIIGLNAYFTGQYPSEDYNIEIRLITPMAREPIVISVFNKEIKHLVKYLKDLDMLLAHADLGWKTGIVGLDLKSYGTKTEYW